MKTASSKNTAFAACTFEISTTGNRIQLFPAGTFRANDTRPVDCKHWVLTDAVAKKVMARLAARPNRIVIDYEHQTLLTQENGKPAPAAGWWMGKNAVWEASGLFVDDVMWTDAARAMIDKKEYLYISPVFSYDRTTGEIIDVFHAALTNNPGLDGMEEVTIAASRLASQSNPSENPMNPKLLALLIQLLGLAEDATEADVLAALEKAVADMPTPEGQPASLTSLLAVFKDKDTKLGEKDTEIAALKLAVTASATKNPGQPDPAKYVPIAVVTDMQKQMAALTGRLDSGELETIVQEALKAGKLLPAMEPWARELGGKDIAALRSFVEASAPIAALTSTQTGGKQPGAGDKHGLTAVELNIAALAGLTPDEFAAAKKLMPENPQ
ncbi:phage protease [Budviciaceae bacterium CWB-B4]|uniref:Phage protease n=1 Tax=Limnobaculum xujianqingii TaxID=2738837 RepID=A0A9D7FS48_9GAMM|nr:phage protease [Limnobaculum xujianqingii]MBK5072569.1 phage protease [Limnobaculum xujianqingii]MBK5175878.1 phage protease [Limnobaculum xujianqingii]